MDANKALKPTFNWGDVVKVKHSAPFCFNAGKMGSVVGMRMIETENDSNQFQQPKGSYLFWWNLRMVML